MASKLNINFQEIYKSSYIKIIKMKIVLDNFLKDHYKLKAEFASICIFKTLIALILIFIYSFEGRASDFLGGIFIVLSGCACFWFFRNSIVLFSSMLTLFIMIIKSIQFFGYGLEIFTILKIPENINVIESTHKTLYLLLSACILNFFTHHYIFLKKPSCYFKKQHVISGFFILFIVFQHFTVISIILSFFINLYVTVLIANEHLNKMNNIIEFNFNNCQEQIMAQQNLFKESALLNIRKKVMHYGPKILKIIPAVFLYSTFSTYEHWILMLIENNSNGRNEQILTLFKYIYL